MLAALFAQFAHKHTLPLMLAFLIALAPAAGTFAVLCMTPPSAMAMTHSDMHSSAPLGETTARPEHGGPVQKLVCIGACSQLPVSIDAAGQWSPPDNPRPIYLSAAAEPLVGYRAPPDLEPPRL